MSSIKPKAIKAKNAKRGIIYFYNKRIYDKPSKQYSYIIYKVFLNKSNQFMKLLTDDIPIVVNYIKPNSVLVEEMKADFIGEYYIGRSKTIPVKEDILTYTKISEDMINENYICCVNRGENNLCISYKNYYHWIIGKNLFVSGYFSISY
jgi:hypothetical protein